MVVPGIGMVTVSYVGVLVSVSARYTFVSVMGLRVPRKFTSSLAPIGTLFGLSEFAWSAAAFSAALALSFASDEMTVVLAVFVVDAGVVSLGGGVAISGLGTCPNFDNSVPVPAPTLAVPACSESFVDTVNDVSLMPTCSYVGFTTGIAS